ncbi:ABC transporter permease [Natrinema thermotolerans]|uniref:ABC transporter permease n=1 Tax=Natrinema thermotolerans TaxID=121872 RepID=A0AAF0PC08_9EURY|nr:ABC transporter permease [Natrinema thermotolerans]QCC58994.1 ABC transporter [Natrinema thermotolerans]WMT05938.1 ABC transporter permease [Natrinema thermotolerans]
MSSETGTPAESAGTSGSASSSINPESVRAVAKKDFQDSIRSWLFWGLSVFFFTLMAVLAGFLAWANPDDFTTLDFIGTISQVTKLVIPLIALVLGWKSIAGERESGSIKVLLSLPHSRKDVLLGKLLGRTAVLSLSLIIGFLIAMVAVAFAVSEFSLPAYLGFLVMTLLYALAYMSIAVSLSSLTRSTTMAGAAMFGVFVLFYIVWNSIQQALRLLMNRDYFEGVAYTVSGPGGRQLEFTRLPDWALFIDMIDPGNAYQNTITIFSALSSDQIGTAYNEAAFPDGLPFFLQDWFSFVILLFWIAVPIAVALYRFDRVDI